MEHQRVPRNTVTKRDEHWCTSGMQNSLVYPKSTWDEAHFPFIGSIAIPCSTEYSTSGLNSLRKLQRFSETPASSLYEYSLQHSSMKKVAYTTYRFKMRADSLSLTEELSQFSTSTLSGVFPQQLVGERDSVFSVSGWMYHKRPYQKEGQISLQWLKLDSCFMSQDEGMSESPVETQEKAVGLRFIWTGGITSLWYLKRHTEFKDSKRDDAWLFFKMDSNPNITVPTRKWALVSCLTSRSVHIVLPSLA